METHSNTFRGNTTRAALVAGARTVASAVASTIGPKGMNAILRADAPPYYVVTNDGVSIAREIHMDDPMEELGADIMREVANRADKESGDGTTTTMVLADAILGDAGQSFGMEEKRSLDACVPLIDVLVDEQKKKIGTGEVKAVASISAEDEELGQVIQDIYERIGPSGIIELDVSGLRETTWEEKDGVRLRNCGYMMTYMPNKGGKAVYSNPKILIARQVIKTLNDIDPIFKQLADSGIHELVMFVEDISPEVLQPLAYTHGKGIFKTLVIKAPMLWKDWLFEDFAAITGATIVGLENGIMMKNATLQHLGTCDKLVTGMDETIVTGIKDVSSHIEKIRELGGDDAELRVSWLQTKAAVLRIGANSESELSYKRLKAEDARNAAWLALQDGIVPGGGSMLASIADKMPDTVGGNILRKALKAPAAQIAKNAGYDLQIGADYSNGMGFDANKMEFRDMFEAGIVDPAGVVKNAVRNAVSVAGTVLTAEIVTLKKKDA